MLYDISESKKNSKYNLKITYCMASVIGNQVIQNVPFYYSSRVYNMDFIRVK